MQLAGCFDAAVAVAVTAGEESALEASSSGLCQATEAQAVDYKPCNDLVLLAGSLTHVNCCMPRACCLALFTQDALITTQFPTCPGMLPAAALSCKRQGQGLVEGPREAASHPAQAGLPLLTEQQQQSTSRAQAAPSSHACMNTAYSTTQTSVIEQHVTERGALFVEKASCVVELSWFALNSLCYVVMAKQLVCSPINNGSQASHWMAVASEPVTTWAVLCAVCCQAQPC